MVSAGRTVFFFLLFWTLSLAPALALSIKEQVGRDRIGPGESLELQLRLDESPPVEPDLGPLEKDWEILSQAHSSQRRYVNGKLSSSFIYNFTLMPRRSGSLDVPPVCFGTSCSRTIPVEVSTQSTLTTSLEEQVQLETRLSEKPLFPQSQLLLKVRLSILAGLPEGRLSDPAPVGVKVQIKKLGDVRKYDQRSNGRTYQVFDRVYAIFPQESGTMQIPPLQFDGLVAGERTRLHPFSRQGMRIRVQSEPFEVEVRPLPADLGRRPWTPATRLSLEDDWQQNRPKLVVGEPATRTLRISAEGLLAAQLPELDLNLPGDFKAYPDQPVREEQLVQSGVKGVMEQKVLLVPTRPGHYRLPEIKLDWWDLGAGQWKTAKLAPLEVDVEPAIAAAPPAPPLKVPAADGKVSQEPAGQGVSALPSEPSEPVGPQALSPAAPGFWPWLSLALGSGWLLTLIHYWRRRRGSSRADEEPDQRSLNAQAARQVLLNAARRNDPQASRQALVNWGRALYPGEPSPYERLRRTCPEPVTAALRQLDQHLYAAAASEWQGAGLVAAIDGWTPGVETKPKGQLPGLYPGD